MLSTSQVWAMVAVGISAIRPLAGGPSSIDLAYHVRVGETILTTGAIPRFDTLTYTVSGQPWLDQQWGAQALLALAYRRGEWAGLVLLRTGLVLATFALLFLACRAAGARPRTAALLTVGAVVATLPATQLRPQLFAMVLFSATTWIVTSRRRYRRLILAIPLIAAVWANLHGSFVLAPALLVLAWLHDRRHEGSRATGLLWLALASAATTLVNPFGARVWTYLAELTSNEVIRESISEWQPPSIGDFGGAAFFLSVGAIAAYLALRGRKTSVGALITFGTFFALGLTANRAVIWWALAAPVALAAELATGVARHREGHEGREPGEPIEAPSILNTGIAAVLALLLVLALPGVARTADPAAWIPPDVPEAATSWLDAELAPGDRLFAPQPWGSWFELALPENPVSVDSRIELYSADSWRRSQSVALGQEGWQGTLDRWDVAAVVIEPSGRGLFPRISNDDAWHRAFADADAAVFVRSPTASA